MRKRSRFDFWFDDVFLDVFVNLLPLWIFVAAFLAWAIGRLTS